VKDQHILSFKQTIAKMIISSLHEYGDIPKTQISNTSKECLNTMQQWKNRDALKTRKALKSKLMLKTAQMLS